MCMVLLILSTLHLGQPAKQSRTMGNKHHEKYHKHSNVNSQSGYNNPPALDPYV